MERNGRTAEKRKKKEESCKLRDDRVSRSERSEIFMENRFSRAIHRPCSQSNINARSCYIAGQFRNELTIKRRLYASVINSFRLAPFSRLCFAKTPPFAQNRPALPKQGMVVKRGGAGFRWPPDAQRRVVASTFRPLYAGRVVADIPGIDKIMSALLTRFSRGGRRCNVCWHANRRLCMLVSHAYTRVENAKAFLRARVHRVSVM